MGTDQKAAGCVTGGQLMYTNEGSGSSTRHSYVGWTSEAKSDISKPKAPIMPAALGQRKERRKGIQVQNQKPVGDQWSLTMRNANRQGMQGGRAGGEAGGGAEGGQEVGQEEGQT